MENKPTAYCLKCKSKQEMIDVKESSFKNGTPVLEGKCPICGMKLFKIIKKQK